MEGTASEAGGLVFRGFKYVKEKKPKSVIFENSPLLLTCKKFAHVKKKILKTFKDLGYTVHATILDTKDGGRHRESLVRNYSTE